jgi:branched-chain amino acid transport system substrate-binding protein
MKKYLAVLLIALVSLTPLSTRAADPEPYEINVILSLTGIAAFLGNQELTTLKALEPVENKNGGIHGRPIKFVTYDDGSNPFNTVQLANQIIAKNVPLIMGPTLGASCEAVYALVKTGPVEYCFAPTLQSAPGSYAFSASVGTPDLAIANVRYFRERGYKRIAMISSTDISGQNGEQVVLHALTLLENKSVILTADEHFGISDVSVGAQLARIKASNPEAIIVWSTGTPNGTVLRGLHAIGLDLPTSLNAGNIVATQMRSYATFMPSHLYLPGYRFMAADLVQSGPVKNEMEAFFAAFAAIGVKPEAAHSFAWDATRVAINALRHLGPNPTATQLRDAIEQTHGYAGINTIMDFRDGSQRGTPISAVVMIEWSPSADKFIPVSKPGGSPLAK